MRRIQVDFEASLPGVVEEDGLPWRMRSARERVVGHCLFERTTTFHSRNVSGNLCGMHGSRDDSVWKNLALAFGDGIAFGVGATLSKNATARIAPPRAEVRTLAERLSQIETRIERARQNNALPGQFNQKVLEAVVSVVDTRLREQEGRFEQKLAEAVAGLRAEFGEQIAGSRRQAEEGNEELRGQMVSLHRQFAESLAKMVDEQIAATIDLRVAPVEERLREEIHEQSGRAVGLVASAADECVKDRMQPMESAVTELERRVTDGDRNTLELVLALGQLCVQTAERLSAPDIQAQVQPAVARTAPQVEAESEPAAQATESEAPVEAPAEQSVEAAAAAPDKPKTLWRVPLVSSFFIATGSLILLHYL